jgi:hypothetical protein
MSLACIANELTAQAFLFLLMRRGTAGTARQGADTMGNKKPGAILSQKWRPRLGIVASSGRLSYLPLFSVSLPS